MRRRKKGHEEEANEERWLLTYADMITLLVAFFMMMYSMSVLNLEKFKKAALGIRSGFNGSVPEGKDAKAGDSIVERGSPKAFIPKPVIAIVPGKGVEKKHKEGKGDAAHKRGYRVVRSKPIGPPTPTAAQLRAQRVGALTAKLNKQLEGLVGKGKAAQIIGENKGVAIELIGDMIFFPKDSAHLSGKAKKILDVVVSILSTLPNEISVEGHTSKYVTWQNSPFANSWELSTARAMAVVTYFMQTHKIQPARISVTGYGQYRPLHERSKNKGSNAASEINKDDRVRVFIYQD
jgi:chemotaxis protein MotB